MGVGVGCGKAKIRALAPLTPHTVELILTLGGLFPRGGPRNPEIENLRFGSTVRSGG